MSSVDSALKESLGSALGRLSSGVYIVTLLDSAVKHGMLATWIIQAAFEPPMLTLAAQRQREILPYINKGSRFAVNALSKKNMDIFKSFARPWKEGLDRFEGLNLSEKGSAGPVFADALSYLDCTVSEKVEAGDHFVFLAEITGGEVLNADEPMLHTRKNGFQY